MKKHFTRKFLKPISVLLASTLIVSSFSIDVFAQNDDNGIPTIATDLTSANNNDAIDPVVVVSLGDSYSSGEGIPPFYGQDKPLAEKVRDEDWLAHRSQLSWSTMLEIPGLSKTLGNYNVKTSTSQEAKWYFVASSGAETKHIITEGQEKKARKVLSHDSNDAVGAGIYSTTLPKQIDIFNDIDKNTVDYVTLTIGGNDVGFANIITTCVVKNNYIHFGKGLHDQIEEIWADFDTTKENIRKTYDEIEKSAGNQAEIIVAGYPKLLNEKGNKGFISGAEATYVNANVVKFNAEIEKIVKECQDDPKGGMNIHFVDVAPEFDGHEAYTSDPWINEVMFLPRAEDINDLSIKSDYSIHPNEKGAKAYARCVNEVIKKIDEEDKGNGSEDSTDYSSDYIYHFTHDDFVGKVCTIDEYIGTDHIVEIPEKIEGITVLNINDEAFYKNTNVTKITVPETVKRIGTRAFSGCIGLVEINLPETLWYLGIRVFEDCTLLESLKIPKGIEDVPAYLCWKCSSLKSIVIPYGVKTIGDSSFYFTAIENIYIPDGVESIGTYAFGLAVKYVSIPETTEYHKGGWFGLNDSFVNYGNGGTIEFYFRKSAEDYLEDYEEG